MLKSYEIAARHFVKYLFKVKPERKKTFYDNQV